VGGRHAKGQATTGFLGGPAGMEDSRVMTWETWAQVAGVGGFVLGVYNAVQGRREPVRLHQRDLRRQLRSLLFEIRKELEDAERRLNHGSLGAVPSRLQEVNEEVRRSMTGLMSPGDVERYWFTACLAIAIDGWAGYKSTPGPDRRDGPKYYAFPAKGRFRIDYEVIRTNPSPTVSELRDLLYRARSSATWLIHITVKIDNGSSRTYRKYKTQVLTRRRLNAKRAHERMVEAITREDKE